MFQQPKFLDITSWSGNRQLVISHNFWIKFIPDILMHEALVNQILNKMDFLFLLSINESILQLLLPPIPSSFNFLKVAWFQLVDLTTELPHPH
jgi:hypothetical protein